MRGDPVRCKPDLRVIEGWRVVRMRQVVEERERQARLRALRQVQPAARPRLGRVMAGAVALGVALGTMLFWLERWLDR